MQLYENTLWYIHVASLLRLFLIQGYTMDYN